VGRHIRQFTRIQKIREIEYEGWLRLEFIDEVIAYKYVNCNLNL